MKILALAMAGTALLVSGCNRSGGPDAANQDVMVDAGNAAGTDAAGNGAVAAMPTTAQDFANAAAASDRFEIESSRLAQASGQSAAIRDFAAQMISGHTASTAKLKSTLAAMSPPVTPNDALNAEQQALLDGLRGRTGAELDRAYASAQVTAHQKTLDMLNAYATGGDTPALVDFAKGMIPTVTAHLNLAKGLK
jgi:putative membrane protein